MALFCASYITTQAHTFATLQKKLALSTITYDILTQAGPENHSKNDVIFLNQALERRGEGGAGDWPDSLLKVPALAVAVVVLANVMFFSG